jgi:hypothetical protein
MNSTVVEILHEGGRASGVRYYDETGQSAVNSYLQMWDFPTCSSS